MYDFSIFIEVKLCLNNCIVVVFIFKNKFGRYNVLIFCNKLCEEEILEV